MVDFFEVTTTTTTSMPSTSSSASPSPPFCLDTLKGAIVECQSLEAVDAEKENNLGNNGESLPEGISLSLGLGFAPSSTEVGSSSEMKVADYHEQEPRPGTLNNLTIQPLQFMDMTRRRSDSGQNQSRDYTSNGAHSEINIERIRIARANSHQEAIVKNHLREMENLVWKIQVMKKSGTFDFSNARDVGTLNATQKLHEEMKEQHRTFLVMKQRAENFDHRQYIQQLKRESYRLKNRLPALAKRLEIEDRVQQFSESKRFLIVQGQTGSGKSTQVPQYLADHPRFQEKRIVVTQPRKIAAISLAKRLAMEYSGGYENEEPGDHIGYQVGGQQRVYGRRIEFVTEGIMLERILGGDQEPFANVGCIVVDEAHERSIICDILLGSFKQNDPRWKHCLVVVMSATIDLQEFSVFFNRAPTVEFGGRTFPVEKIYEPMYTGTEMNVQMIRSKVVERARDIHISAGHSHGDILCFLPGQDDVICAKEDFEEEINRIFAAQSGGGHNTTGLLDVCVFSLFGRMDPSEQEKVFKPLPKTIRKVIFATDVAETSVTIDGVVHVVDSGVRKEMIFDPRRNISTLRVTTISQSSATQRAGRSGRTQAGVCHRLYSEEDYLQMNSASAPEVFKKPLSLAILTLLEMNIVPKKFDWISAPSPEGFSNAEEELRYLGAINESNKCTELGKLICLSQQEPKLVRMIHSACLNGFGVPGVTIAAIFTVSNMFFYRGMDDETRTASKAARNSWALEDGDIVTMYRVFQKYLLVREGKDEDGEPLPHEDVSGRRREQEWCRKNFVNGKAIGLILSTRKELIQIFRSTFVWKSHLHQTKEPSDEELRRLVLSGYFLNVARLIHNRKSRIPSYFAMHAGVSGSLDFKCAIVNHKKKEGVDAVVVPPEWVVYEKILRLDSVIFPTTTPIHPDWLMEECPEFYQLCLDKEDDLPTEKIVVRTSQECIRTIFGRFFVNLPALESELECDLDVDSANGILAAYCSPLQKPSIESTLKDKIDSIVASLSEGTEEVDYLGATRIVVGQGYEVKEILFPQEYVTICLRSLHRGIQKNDLITHFVRLGIYEAIVKFDFRDYDKNRYAVIKMRSKSEARAVLETLKEGPSVLGQQLQPSPAGLGPKRGVTQEEAHFLKLSWAAGTSQGIAKISFQTAKEANKFISSCPLIFPGAKVTVVHGEVSNISSKRKFEPPKPEPPAFAMVGIPSSMCRFRFIDTSTFNLPRMVGAEPSPQYEYKVTVAGLSPDIDEQEICRRLQPSIPIWTKVTRTYPQESYEMGISVEEKAQKLLPLQKYISVPDYIRFHFDKNLGRGILYIPVEDKVALQKASKRVQYPSHHGQPQRLEIEWNHTTAIHKDLYSFLQKDIKEIKEFARTKGAYVSDSSERKVEYKARIQREVKFIYLRFRSCSQKVMRELQNKVETISNCSRYHNDNIKLLFSHAAEVYLDALWETSFVHMNLRNYAVWIYGKPQVQEDTKKALDRIVGKLKTMEVDIPILLNKKKLNLTGNPMDIARLKLERICTASCIDSYSLMGNQILASGAKTSIERLQKLLKEASFIFERRPSHLVKQFGKPDCDLCLCPVEDQFVRSSLCSHSFCADCIQQMFTTTTAPSVPVKCPGGDCDTSLGISDILKAAKKESMKALLEVALKKYQESHDNEVFFCPKPDCGQLLSVHNKAIGEYGGEFYFCDECVTTYCLPCSKKLDKPIRSHEFDSCEEALNGVSDQVRVHVKFVQEQIFNLKCPRCSTVFLDWSGCVAVFCESCKCGFCGACLQDCGQDAHSHVLICPKNRSKSYYLSEAEIVSTHKELRAQKLKDYFFSVVKDHNLACGVLRALRRDLIDLDLDEEFKDYRLLEDANPNSPISTHVQHIQNKILTLCCPRPSCSRPFGGFDACAAVTCSCGCHFCGLCLMDCGDDSHAAHAHVLGCSYNPSPASNGVFVDEANLKIIHRQLRITRLKDYLNSIPSGSGMDNKELTLAAILPDLKDHGIQKTDVL